jgi:hypothetical protein
MKYRVVTPLARIGQAFAVGDLIEIQDKAEAARMIAANIVAPITGMRETPVETAVVKHSGVEKAVKAVKPGRKKG